MYHVVSPYAISTASLVALARLDTTTCAMILTLDDAED